MSLRLPVSLLTLGLLSGCVIDDVNNAKQLDKQGSSNEAEMTLNRLANEGYWEAKLALAAMYADPKKGSYSPENATELYRSLLDIYPKAELGLLKLEMTRITEEEAGELYSKIWHRQNTSHDALPLLVSFYKRYYTSFDVNELAPELNKLIISGRHSMALKYASDFAPIENINKELKQYCQSAPRNDQINCYKLAVINQTSNQNDQQKLDLVSQLEQAHSRGDVSSDDIAAIAHLAKSRRIGGPNATLYVSLAQIVGAEKPQLWFQAMSTEYRYLPKHSLRAGEIITQANVLAAQGYTPAHVLIGNAYLKGKGVQQNYRNAVEHWHQASEIPEAQRLLGETYISGKLGDQHLQTGVNWLLKAARNKQDKAYLTLSKVFEQGNGVIPNSAYSHAFLSVYNQLSANEQPANSSEDVRQDARVKQLIKQEMMARNAIKSHNLKDNTP